ERNGFLLPKEVFAGWGWDATPGYIPTFDNFFASARYAVNGSSNNDTTTDVGYSIELRIDLDSLGYNANGSGDDVIELNFSIWDADWNWPNDPARFSSNKTWWQNPWNNLGNNVARVYVNPNVTINSTGPFNEPEQDITISNGEDHPSPTIDGNLSEGVWSNLSSFDVHFGDVALRATYPSIGKYRSGEWQGGGYPNPVVDPGNATVKWFFKGDKLYVGVEISDELVQSDASDDWLDGIQLSVTIPNERNGDNTMKAVRYGVRVDSVSKGGKAAIWDLTEMVDSGKAWYGLALKGATTIDDPSDVDEGYTIELCIDLTKIGYEAGSPDKMVLLGFSYLDGDKFTNTANDYGTRTWWFREWPWACAPAWCLLENSSKVSGATTLSVAMADKWNLISVPVTVGDYAKTTLFPSSTSDAFAYSGGYNPTTILDNGPGYWLKFNGNQSVSLNGTIKTDDTVTVVAGWNLIGSVTYSIPVANILSIPGGLVTSNFFSYANGYNEATTIDPGKAYWVKVSGAGQLLLQSNPTFAANRIKIVPTNELPPPPPRDLTEEEKTLPTVFAVHQNYPNPFNPTTSIRFDLPEQQKVMLKVYDILGREVVTLLNNEEMNAGVHSVQFSGNNIASGMYYYRLQAGEKVEVRKMLLTK
ncbi:MAG: T9SS type A sorting domain-containing protein, partial [Ignavibacteriae bacterium]|nr:T9SS type A sorting domain-containing protein [Ignavibacteriota bacterium]